MHTHYLQGTPIFIRLKSGQDVQGKFADHKSGMIMLDGGKKIKISDIRFMSPRKLNSPAIRNESDDDMILKSEIDKKTYKSIDNATVIDMLSRDGVGILPTDTIYGLVGSALSEKAVKRIYVLRKRDKEKPMVVLIGRKDDLKLLKVKIGAKEEKILSRMWPGKVTVILPCKNERNKYLHRGTKTLAIRFPNHQKLLSLLKKIGPLVAPSANPQGFNPALTIDEAKKYFKNKVDFYVDAGRLESKPSTLIALEKNEITIKRQGAGKIKWNNNEIMFI